VTARAIALLLLASASIGPSRQPEPASPGSRELGARVDHAILMISLDDPGQMHVQQIVQGFQEILAEVRLPPLLYLEFFDQVRFAQTAYPEEFYQWLHRKYRDRRVDVIVAVQQRTLQVLAAQPDSPWHRLPVVYSSLGDLTIDISKSLPMATGVIRENNFPAALRTIKTLLPDTKRIALIYGGSAAEQERNLWFVPQVTEAGFDVVNLSGLKMDDLLARVAQLPAGTVPFFLEFQADITGRSFTHSRACELIAAAANRPLFALFRHYFGCGVVGGPLTDFVEVGRLTARHAVKRLGSESAATVTVPLAQYAPLVFDARQLTRWRFAESRLPAGSTVLFRKPSLWRDYRREVIAAVTVAVVQTLLIVVVLLERRRRGRAQVALSKSFLQLQDLAGRLVAAEEQARTRIARDLHDDFGQRVASLSIGLSDVRRMVPVPHGELHEQVSALQQQTTELATGLRELSHDLHPGVLKFLGLVAALRGRCNDMTAQTGIQVRLEVSDAWLEIPDVAALCLYRVAQEALRNIAQHAQATTASVSLSQQNGHVEMRITDDGRGFEQGAMGRGAGLGLVSLDERIRMLAGSFDIRTSESIGTTLVVTLPVEPRQPTGD
jgi:signal transduction histidine kinase